jgi:tRNA-specific 2-thiouridylase
VRALGEKIGLPNAHRKESQDICFLGGKVSIQDFLSDFLPEEPGDIVTKEGKILGRHRGLYRYTLGQRKGISIPSNCDFEKFVVVGKDLKANRLIVAFDSDRHNGLWVSAIELCDTHFITDFMEGHHRLHVKVRYRDPAIPASITFRDDGSAAVEFSKEQRALAPGQVCAFYAGSQLLGSGIYAASS